MKKQWFGAVAAMALGVCCTGAAFAEEHFAIAIDGIRETRNLPVLVAERLGYFKKDGLAVTLVDALADPTVDERLAAGQVDGGIAFYHHTIMLQAAGQDVQSVLVLAMSPALKLMLTATAREKMSSAADLKGLRIYTGGQNSGKTTATNWLMRSNGFRPEDYRPLDPKVGRDKIAAALAGGQADGVMAHEPDASFYEAQHVAGVFADLTSVEGTRRALGSDYPTTALYLPKSTIAARSNAVCHLVSALLRGLDYVNSHSAEEIQKILPSDGKGPSLATLAEDKRMFATNGLVSEDAARMEWRVMADLQPKYGTVAIERTFTNRFAGDCVPKK